MTLSWLVTITDVSEEDAAATILRVMDGGKLLQNVGD
jgi:hypothetical protein